MSSRDLFELEHGDTGVALLPCPDDEHMLNTCHYCLGSGIVEDYDGDMPCSRCDGLGHVHEACKVNGQGASAPHSDRDKSEQPTAGPTPQPDQRIKKLVSLSRWERAGMLAYIAATFPQVFDETYAALGLAEP